MKSVTFHNHEMQELVAGMVGYDRDVGDLRITKKFLRTLFPEAVPVEIVNWKDVQEGWLLVFESEEAWTKYKLAEPPR